MNIKLNELFNSDLKEWLRIKLASKWSERDINILYDVLQAEFQKNQALLNQLGHIESILQRCF